MLEGGLEDAAVAEEPVEDMELVEEPEAASPAGPPKLPTVKVLMCLLIPAKPPLLQYSLPCGWLLFFHQC